MEVILNWFRKKNYKVGVAIYEQLGTSDFLKKIFQKGDGDYNRKRLEKELKALLPEGTFISNFNNNCVGESLNGNELDGIFIDEYPDKISEKNKPYVGQWPRSLGMPRPNLSYFDYQREVLNEPVPEVPLYEDDFEYLKLIRRRDQVYRQIDRNMVLLDTSTSKNRRFEAAKQIKTLHRSKVKIWSEIDYFEEHGSIMPVAVKPELKTDELQRLYVQICRAKERLEKTDLRNREKTEKLLKTKLARVEEIRKERLGHE